MLLALAGLSLWGTGCCTEELWDNWPTQHYQPAPNSEVKMFLCPGNNDVLVQYVEQREKTGAIRPRAYYAMANAEHVLSMKKPYFVKPQAEWKMVMIPVEMNGITNLPVPLWAELTPRADGFRLYRHGIPDDWQHLPVYIDKRDQAELILLTPVAVAGDTVIIGGAVAVVGGFCYLVVRYNIPIQNIPGQPACSSLPTVPDTQSEYR